MSGPVVLLLVAIAVVVGFVLGGMFQKPAVPPGPGIDRAANAKFTFKGHFAVYPHNNASQPPKKRPKNWIRVLYHEVNDVQVGTVTFDNWTEKNVKIEFATSPFAAGQFDLPPGGSSGPQQLTQAPQPGAADDYPFTVSIEDSPGNWTVLDPGVRVRNS